MTSRRLLLAGFAASLAARPAAAMTDSAASASAAAPTPASPLFPAGTPLPRPVAGRVERLGVLGADGLDARPVDVWLPPSYDREPGHRYPVLVMHDGQNVFDGALVLGPWGGWHVDEAIARLHARGEAREAIVVAVWNTGPHRYADYYPTPALAHLPAPLRERFVAHGLDGRSRGEAYVDFLADTVLPAVAARHRTLASRDDTMLMGSSMGGLVSLFAMSRRPETFGAAACLSTHWVGSVLDDLAFPLAALAWFHQHLPDAATHRLWMDHGTLGLDAGYGEPQALMDRIAAAHGYAAPRWHSQVYPGTDHNERSWAARLEEPLRFLLGA